MRAGDRRQPGALLSEALARWMLGASALGHICTYPLQAGHTKLLCPEAQTAKMSRCPGGAAHATVQGTEAGRSRAHACVFATDTSAEARMQAGDREERGALLPHALAFFQALAAPLGHACDQTTEMLTYGRLFLLQARLRVALHR